MRPHPEFRDRHEAGRRLAKALTHYAAFDPVILGLPRGGVPVAYEVAVALGAELDVVFVRKIGAPGHEELGIGAVVDGANPQLVLNEDVVRQLGPSPNSIRSEMRKQLETIEKRRHLYRGEMEPVELKDRTVILVDDGIATGGTVRAALTGLRKNDPARLILAVPVAPADTLAQLAKECDDVVCLVSPSPFYAVGAHYLDFTQTGDEEVIHLMREARGMREPGG
jgi:putative phosphoribosyl transferase